MDVFLSYSVYFVADSSGLPLSRASSSTSFMHLSGDIDLELRSLTLFLRTRSVVSPVLQLLPASRNIFLSFLSKLTKFSTHKIVHFSGLIFACSELRTPKI
jgi:Sec7-like guanine-nucleotide exchange factor